METGGHKQQQRVEVKHGPRSGWPPWHACILPGLRPCTPADDRNYQHDRSVFFPFFVFPEHTAARPAHHFFAAAWASVDVCCSCGCFPKKKKRNNKGTTKEQQDGTGRIWPMAVSGDVSGDVADGGNTKGTTKEHQRNTRTGRVISGPWPCMVACLAAWPTAGRWMAGR